MGRTRVLKTFTLIELLVVVAILAALTAVLMPAPQRICEQAREVICRNNLHQLALAQMVHVDDSDGRFVGAPTRLVGARLEEE